MFTPLGHPSSPVIHSNTHHHHTHDMINNAQNVYIPLRLPCGVRLRCRPDVFLPASLPILAILQDDLVRCLEVLPPALHAWIRRDLVIWVNVSYHMTTVTPSTPSAPSDKNDTDSIPCSSGTTKTITRLTHTCTHHSTLWLEHVARDRLDKVYGIEIYSVVEFRKLRRHWNGCGLLLHELCHWIHDGVLGLDCLRVQRVYYQHHQAQKYTHVLRRDWRGQSEERDLAYATVDYKEFFAEFSVAYWSLGYGELDTAPTDCVASCSPPVSTADAGYWSVLNSTTPPEGHCNKFYPFTRGQFQQYDPELFAEMKAIWDEIAAWKDPYSVVKNPTVPSSTEHDSCCRCPSLLPKRNPKMFSSSIRGALDHELDYLVSPFERISDTVDL